MKNRLRELREKAGLKQNKLAELADTSPPQIQRLEKGERTLTVEWAERLAPILKVHPASLIFDTSELVGLEQTGTYEAVAVDIDFEPVPVVGQVEAGSYRTSERWDEQDFYYMGLPVDKRYPQIKRFCLEVRGNSMDLIYPPGTLVICVDMIQINGEPKDGDIYVVDYTNIYGEIESTLKELSIQSNGKYILIPRSSDPAHKQPIEINGNKGDTIRLRAKVVGSYSER